MEVSGKNLMNDIDAKLCSFCEDFDLTTCADGFCVECEVYFCHSCFGKHKARKISRNHTMVAADSVKITADDTYDTCQQHKGEFVKFYCPKHDQVCCGECSVLNHNRCELKFIRDKVAALSISQDSRNIKEEIARCKKEVEDSVSLLVINRQQLAELYEQFVRDVEAFADHVIERIQIMKTSVLNQAKEVMLNDKKKMDDLQEQTDDLIAELSRQNIMLESKINQPHKFFVASLQVKSYLKNMKRNVDIVKKKNIVTQYKFKSDEKLAESIKESNVIGSLIELSENIQQHQDEFKKTLPSDNRQVHDPLPQVQDPLPQPLHDRKLVCRNVKIDGECLSYAVYGSNAIGLYVLKENLRVGLFFEIEILSMGKSGSLAFGVVPDNYPDNLLPGVGENSFGYHSNGNVFRGSTSGKQSGDAWKVGDRIKCQFGFLNRRRLKFTNNGKRIHCEWMDDKKYYFAVGMEGPGGKVRVTKVPEM